MLSNLVLLSLMRKATPIKPRAKSGASFRSLLSTFNSIVPFLKSISFYFYKCRFVIIFYTGVFNHFYRFFTHQLFN